MALLELRTWNHLAAGGWGRGAGGGGRASRAGRLSASTPLLPGASLCIWSPAWTHTPSLLPGLPPQRPCRPVRPSPSSAWILQVFALCYMGADPQPEAFP